MSLKANIQTSALGDIIIHLIGNINFENQKELQKEVEIIKKQHPFSSVTLDMNALDFVGSSSISTFVGYLKDLHQKDPNKYKITNVKVSFLEFSRSTALTLNQCLKKRQTMISKELWSSVLKGISY